MMMTEFTANIKAGHLYLQNESLYTGAENSIMVACIAVAGLARGKRRTVMTQAGHDASGGLGT